MKSLQDLMNEAYNLSLDLAYEDMAPNGHYLTPRSNLPTEEADLIYGWADGLMHKYYENRSSGRCSLQATIDFDVAKFEQSVVKDIAKMKIILARVGKPVKLDFAEMRKRGYRGEWAGETPIACTILSKE